MLPVLLIPVLVNLHGFRYPVDTDDNAVKAMFVYNFSKYFDWSDIYEKPEFVIAVYDNPLVVKHLIEITGRKNLNRKTIIIRTVHSPGDLAGSQMLFISGNNPEFIKEAVNALDTESFVIITDSPRGVKYGSHINLLNTDGKFRFELNETRLKENHIKFSRELSALAYRIY